MFDGIDSYDSDFSEPNKRVERKLLLKTLGRNNWVAAAIVVGAAISAYASKESDKAQTEQAEKQLAENQRQFDLLQADLNAFKLTGLEANEKLNQLLAGDRSGFEQDPAYQFLREQGERSVNRLASQQGRLNTGSQSKDLIRFNQNLASQSYNDYVNRLLAISGRGQNAVTNIGQLGQNFQQQQGVYRTQIGNSRASNYTNQGNIANNALNQYVQYSAYNRNNQANQNNESGSLS